VTVAYDLADAESAHALAVSRPGVWTTAGVHPHAAAGWDADAPARIRDLAARRACVALGEMGLDYHYDTAPRAQQRAVFTRQLELAAELDMPAVVHSRSCDDDMIAAIAGAADAVRGVLHCFTGRRALLERALEAGWYISFTGLVSFHGFAGAELVRAVPAERLLIETDSPYLAPVPYRGRRNEPARVVDVAAALARIRGEDAAALAARACEATLRFYDLEGGTRLGVSTY
jgi:TatD DNase family protein